MSELTLAYDKDKQTGRVKGSFSLDRAFLKFVPRRDVEMYKVAKKKRKTQSGRSVQ